MRSPGEEGGGGGGRRGRRFCEPLFRGAERNKGGINGSVGDNFMCLQKWLN